MFYFSVKKQYTSKKQVEAVVSVNGQMGWTICPYKPDVWVSQTRDHAISHISTNV